MFFLIPIPIIIYIYCIKVLSWVLQSQTCSPSPKKELKREKLNKTEISQGSMGDTDTIPEFL